MISSYKLFSVYTQIRLHFTTEYNSFKYCNTAGLIPRDKFEVRPDVYLFEKLANKITDLQHALDFCVFNFAHNTEFWAYDESEISNEIYLKTKGYYAAFTINLKQEYSFIQNIMKEKDISFKKLINITEKGNRPPLLQLVLTGAISKEFVCVIDNGFLQTWIEKYKQDPLLSKEIFTLIKYKPFCQQLSKRILESA